MMISGTKLDFLLLLLCTLSRREHEFCAHLYKAADLFYLVEFVGYLYVKLFWGDDQFLGAFDDGFWFRPDGFCSSDVENSQ